MGKARIVSEWISWFSRLYSSGFCLWEWLRLGYKEDLFVVGVFKCWFSVSEELKLKQKFFFQLFYSANKFSIFGVWGETWIKRIYFVKGFIVLKFAFFCIGGAMLKELKSYRCLKSAQ